MLESEKYWRPFLEDWIDYSNNAENGSKYENKVTLSDDVNYYDTEINGTHFIFTAIPKTEAPTYAFGTEQLEWLDKTLYEKEESGKPIFVFGHVPLETELNGSYWDDQIKDRTEVMAILAKHPTAIYVSGHTHYSLDVDFLSSIDGKQQAPSFIHDGGTTTVNIPNDEANPDETTETQNSHGVVAKVYSDGIELWGRDFVNEKWISRGYTGLTFKSECAIDEISLTKTACADGIVLTANEVEGASYTWVVDGIQSDVTTNSVTVAKDFDGYVALRITTADGAYRSEVFENVADAQWGEVIKSVNEVSMRIGEDDNASGIRYAATINTANREGADEYGFIVTRQTFLTNYGGELTFDFKLTDGTPLYVYGKNYLKNADGTVAVDKVFESLADGIKFTGVVTGLNVDDPVQVCETMVARPYAKITVGGEQQIVYGETVSASLQQIASYIRDNDEEYYSAHSDIIDKLADSKIG